jgi:glucokinase
MQAFSKKGRSQDLMASIPVHVVNARSVIRNGSLQLGSPSKD